MHIGIIGNGFVGNATQLLESPVNIVTVYDRDPKRCSPLGTKLADLNNCKVIFICVPTHMGSDGYCDLSILDQCLTDVRNNLSLDGKFIVCRSTVIIGTCNQRGIYHMPEFLTEKNWRNDFLTCKDWIFGIPDTATPEHITEFKTIINELLLCSPVSGNIHFVSTNSSEMIKYARNCFLATKVGFCNEIASLCEEVKVSWESIRELFAADPRIGPSHTSVPGHDGSRGFGGHCLPKDLSAIVSFSNNLAISTPILSAVLNRNNTIDVPYSGVSQ